MSWAVEKKGEKYRLWSTSVDDWLTPWVSREEAIECIRSMRLSYLEAEIARERESFPLGWWNKKGERYSDQLEGDNTNE